MEHLVPSKRDKFETQEGLTYCRRCGRPIAKDSDPTWVQKKPCQHVKVELRYDSQAS